MFLAGNAWGLLQFAAVWGSTLKARGGAPSTAWGSEQRNLCLTKGGSAYAQIKDSFLPCPKFIIEFLCFGGCFIKGFLRIDIFQEDLIYGVDNGLTNPFFIH